MMIIRLLALCVVLLSLVVGLTMPLVVMAAGDGWKATLLDRSAAPISDPNLVIDPHGGVFAFWKAPLPTTPTGDSSITGLEYAVRMSETWSTPHDAYAGQGISAPSGAVDQFDVLHVFWQADNLLFAGSVTATDVGAAANWSTPQQIDYANPSTAVTTETNGAVDLVYAGSGSRGVLFQRSTDGGHTWSFTSTVAPAEPKSSVNFTRIAVAPEGTIHVVWTEFQLPNGWPPTGVYYARSTDNGKTWSVPIQMAGTGFSQANIVAGPKGLVHVAWNGISGVQGRYDRWSTDGGRTWSKAAVLFVPLSGSVDIGGSTGPPGLAVDSAGAVHVVFAEGNRIWHSEWRDGRWSTPEYVPTGDDSGMPPVTEGIPTKVRDIEQVALAISRGNELIVVYPEVRPNGNSLWYVTKTLDAPLAPLQSTALPTATPPPPPTATPTPVDLITDDPAVKPLTAPDPLASRTVAMLSLVPLATLLGGLFALRIWLGRR